MGWAGKVCAVSFHFTLAGAEAGQASQQTAPYQFTRASLFTPPAGVRILAKREPEGMGLPPAKPKK